MYETFSKYCGTCHQVAKCVNFHDISINIIDFLKKKIVILLLTCSSCRRYRGSYMSAHVLLNLYIDTDHIIDHQKHTNICIHWQFG